MISRSSLANIGSHVRAASQSLDRSPCELSAWFVSMAPWNIYHGGLQFKCRRTNYTYTIDYNAKFDFNITHFLVPTEQYRGDVDEDGFPTGTSLIYSTRVWISRPEVLDAIRTLASVTQHNSELDNEMQNMTKFEYGWSVVKALRMALSGDMIPGLEWRNFGILRLRDFWPHEYTNRTKVGVMTGQQFDELKRWFVEDWARHKDTFDPITIIDAEAGTRVWMSRMCHDLVEYGLKRMAEMGVSLRPARPLLRDHITVYVKPGSLKPLDVRGNAFNRRAVARFMRVYLSFIPKLRDQFIHARDFLRKVLAMDLTPVGYLMGQYYEAAVVSPLVNYCYVPLRMPRLLRNGTVVFGEVDAMKRNRSLCALRNDDVELDNVTLTLEDRLIMLENYIDVFFNAPERRPHYRWAFMTISGPCNLWLFCVNPEHCRSRCVLEYESSPDYTLDDVIDIYVGEYKVAAWFVSMAPWNIYHGGLQFKCRRTNYMYTIDYNAKFDSNITHFLVPTEKYEGQLDDDGFPTGPEVMRAVRTLASLVTGESPDYSEDHMKNLTKFEYGWTFIKALRMALSGECCPTIHWPNLDLSGDMIPGLEWRNFGILRFRDFWPKEYSSRALVGNMTGQQFDSFKRWFIEDWARPRDTFDPVTVIQVESGERIWMSRMCHDLVEHGLKQMVEMGVSIDKTEWSRRLQMSVYVNYIKPLDVRGNSFDRRAVVRFLRLYMSFIPQMREQFIHSRDMLRKALAMGLMPVGYFMGSYYELDIVPPLINYCYIPLNMPRLLPNGSAVYGTVDAMNPNRSLCALPNVDVELGNVTLTIEDRLIMLENYVDLLFNAPERFEHPKHRSVFMMVTGTIASGVLLIAYWARKHKC
ncbi:hypothetical protein FOL46_009027 [Perkinsus olseni]|uniref:Uncharacterized protein n=1 Tax=Perkinsus olseni TaxID=32597 RepID=A0A7J6MLB5_PEROL|nr:hypothetical protein FOL46_009027 [Perkinsus olseni]